MKIYNTFLSFLIIALSFLCVFQIITISKERDFARNYQQEANKINSNYFIQETEESFSLNEVEEIAQKRNFVQSGDVNYVKISSTQVVVK